MRRSILLIVSVFVVVISATAQYSRTFYTTNSPGRTRTFGLAELNGTTWFTAFKRSSADTIRVMIGQIDDLGETSNYVEGQIVGPDFSSLALSGLASDDVSGDLIAAVITNYSGLGYISYLRINPVTGSMQIENTLPNTFDGPFARTRQKGDSLVTWIAEDNVGLVRIAASIANPANYSYQLVQAGTSFSGTLTTEARSTELKTDAAGNEYVSAGNRIYKRTPSGTVTSAVVAGFLTQEFSGTTLAIAGNGNVMVISDNNYALFNANLAPLADGAISYPVASNHKFNELREEGGNWVLFTNNSDGYLHRVVMNNLTSVIQADRISDATCKTVDIALNETHLLMEKREDLVTSPGDMFSQAVIRLGNGVPDPFIEFGQLIELQKLDIHVGHLGNEFYMNGLGPGILYELNGIPRVVNFYSRSFMIGYDDNNDLHIDGATNYFNEVPPGPYTTTVPMPLQQYDKYNRGYYVDRDMIDAHLVAVTNNDPNYVMPFGIREWPAHGDPQYGQAADLAPFVDQNNNGTYEPELGDYPEMYGTRCVLNIFHDQAENNVSGLEHHQYYYVFDCDTSDVLNHTVFMTERIFARAGDYTDAYYSKLADIDIGNPSDDYMGTNVDLGMVYEYNGDGFDEYNGGNAGFQDTLPAFGIQFLKGVPLPDDGIDNAPGSGMPVNGYGFGDGQTDNEYTTLESSKIFYTTTGAWTPLEMYNLSQGNFFDGTPNSVNGVDVRFEYFGDTDPAYYASGGINHGNNFFESTAGNPPGDRMLVGASAPVNLTGGSNEYAEYTTAYITAIDTTAATFIYLQPVKKLFFLGGILKGMYADNNAGCGMNFGPYISDVTLGLEEQTMEFSMYPNPATQSVTIVHEMAGEVGVRMTDLNGKVIWSGTAEQEVTISLAGLESGMYLVTLSSEQGYVTRRLIKM